MNPRRNRDADGFSLIETLVAMLVLAIGLFGMLGIIVNSLKLTFSSNHRTIAAQQASAMAERLRASPSIMIPVNAAAAADTSLAFFSLINPPLAPTCRASGSVNNLDCNCYGSTGCTGANHLGTVLRTWREQLRTVLPQGDGVICRDADPVNNQPVFAATGVLNTTGPTGWNCSGTGGFVVKVCWNEARIAASSASLTAGGLCTFAAM